MIMLTVMPRWEWVSLESEMGWDGLAARAEKPQALTRRQPLSRKQPLHKQTIAHSNSTKMFMEKKLKKITKLVFLWFVKLESSLLHLKATTVSIFWQIWFDGRNSQVSWAEQRSSCFVSLTLSKNKVSDCIGYREFVVLEPASLIRGTAFMKSWDRLAN